MKKIEPISVDNEVLGGTPVFRGTRIPVQSLFDWQETESLDEYLENFPSVKRADAVEVSAQDCRKSIKQHANSPI